MRLIQIAMAAWLLHTSVEMTVCHRAKIGMFGDYNNVIATTCAVATMLAAILILDGV